LLERLAYKASAGAWNLRQGLDTAFVSEPEAHAGAEYLQPREGVQTHRLIMVDEARAEAQNPQREIPGGDRHAA
jgi:hypothetical protein